MFAPSNEAFEKLGDALDLGNLDDKAITFILAYHVYAGMIMSADIQNGFVMALNGDGIYIEEKEGTGRVVLNSESTVTTVDQVGSNGVIHIIDTGKSIS